MPVGRIPAQQPPEVGGRGSQDDPVGLELLLLVAREGHVEKVGLGAQVQEGGGHVRLELVPAEDEGFVLGLMGLGITILLLARRPDEFRAFFSHHDALMDRDSGLSKAEREMIVVANVCFACLG